MPLLHVYSKLYYESRIKDAMQNGWPEEYLKENPTHNPADPIPPPSLKFRNEVTKKLFKNESVDIIREVERTRETMGSQEPTEGDESEAGDSVDNKEHERIKTARQYQACVTFLSSFVYSPTFKIQRD